MNLPALIFFHSMAKHVFEKLSKGRDLRKLVIKVLFLCKMNGIQVLSYLMIKQELRQWHPTPVLLPGKSHGQRSLVGCSLWGHEELDTTERLDFHFSLSCIGEGNGSSLQCSFLENPRDSGAWLAAIYGFAQSRTRLK